MPLQEALQRQLQTLTIALRSPANKATHDIRNEIFGPAASSIFLLRQLIDAVSKDTTSEINWDGFARLALELGCFDSFRSGLRKNREISLEFDLDDTRLIEDLLKMVDRNQLGPLWMEELEKY